MKPILFFIIFLFAVLGSKAQSAHWSLDIKSEVDNDFSDIVTDENGFLYTIGTIGKTNAYVGDFEVSVLGESSLFFAKLSPEGDVLWAKAIPNGSGGMLGHNPTDLIYDTNSQSFFATGLANNYGDSIIGGGFSPFLIRLNLDGELMWAESFVSDCSGAPHNVKVSGGLDINNERLFFSFNYCDQSHTNLIKNELTLEGGSSYILEFTLNGVLTKVEESIPNAEIIREEFGLRTFYSGRFKDSLSLTEDSILYTGPGATNNGVFYSIEKGVLNFSLHFDSKESTITSINHIGNIGTVLFGRYGKNLIVNGDTLEEGNEEFHNSFVMFIDPEGNISWFKTLSKKGETPVGKFCAEFYNNNLVISFVFMDELSYAGENWNPNQVTTTQTGAALLISQIDILSGEILESTVYGNAYLYQGRSNKLKNLNNKLFLLGNYQKEFEIGNVNLERQDSFIPGSAFIIAFDDVSNTHEIKEDEMDQPLQMYSNPSPGVSAVVLPQNFQNEILTLQVTNSLGKVISTKHFMGGIKDLPINIKGQPAGKYIVTISNGSESISGSLILK